MAVGHAEGRGGQRLGQVVAGTELDEPQLAERPRDVGLDSPAVGAPGRPASASSACFASAPT